MLCSSHGSLVMLSAYVRGVMKYRETRLLISVESGLVLFATLQVTTPVSQANMVFIAATAFVSLNFSGTLI